jgi:transglutaminase-like putative cysteine protease
MERSGDPLATQQQTRSTLVAVGVLSGATTLCLARVFREWGWLVPCLVASMGSVALGALVDRWVRRTTVTVIALVLGGALMGLEVSAPASTTAGIPTPSAISDFGHDLSRMAHVLHSAAVPVLPIGSALLLAVMAAWVMGAASYLCATRLAGSLAPLIAPLTVFVTVSALGRGSHAATTALFGAGVACFLLAQQRSALTDRRARFHAGPNRVAVPVAGAVVATVVAIAAALLAGPTLPGAKSGPLIDYHRLGGATRGPGNLVVVTPLVDIRDRLKESPPQELFTVQSDHPSYWRIAGLDQFDGNVWGIAETQSESIDALDRARPSTGTVVPINARFNTTALGGPWVPVPYQPTSVDLAGARVLPSSDTVIIRRTSAINATYDVTSEDPAPTPRELATAQVATDPAATADLRLPGGFPDRVRALAQLVTRGARGQYAQALALQTFLRSGGGFTYSLSVPKGHSDQALVDFLFVSKAGFCEQFSSAFAAMARAIGLPTRVAVGFTTGVADNSGVYHVTSREAHAWPEVDFAGIGWLRFEPTPGRSDPTPGNYTGTADATPLPTAPTPRDSQNTTAPAAPGPTVSQPSLRDPNLQTGSGQIATKRSTASVVLRFIAVTLAVIVGGALLIALTIIGLKALRRYRRRHASTSRARVTGAWDEALERLAEARIHRRPSSTPVEFAMREAPAGGAGDAGPSLLALAHLTTGALYAPDDPEPEVADDAWTKVRELETAMRRHTAARARVRRRLDPRVLRATLPGDAEVGDDGSADDALVVVTTIRP